MKYLLNFNEGVEMNNKLWRITTLTHYYKHDIQNFNMRDLEELSIFFNDNHPDINYGLDYNKVKLETIFGIDTTSGGEPDLNNYKIFNEDNSFAFKYKLYVHDKDYPNYRGSSNVYDKLVLVTKNTDDYFLVLERSSGLFNGKITTYICDDLEGLLEFLNSYFSNKHPLVNGGKQSLYIEDEL